MILVVEHFVCYFNKYNNIKYLIKYVKVCFSKFENLRK